MIVEICNFCHNTKTGNNWVVTHGNTRHFCTKECEQGWEIGQLIELLGYGMAIYNEAATLHAMKQRLYDQLFVDLHGVK